MGESNPNPETPKTREELFKEDPNRFIDANEIIIAIIRTPEGPQIACNLKDSSEARRVMIACNMELATKIIVMDAKARQGSIIKPKGGIINAARNRLFKR